MTKIQREGDIMKKLRNIIISLLLAVMLVIPPVDFSCFAADAKNAKDTIVGLSVNYMTNPIGIDDTNPVFGWKMVSDVRGRKQTAYQIQVSRVEEKVASGNAEIWDSGKVESDVSVAITYQGAKLEPMTRYFWRVLVWDDNNAVLSSEVNYFETGLMDSGWSGAKWIGRKTLENEALSTLTDFTISVDFRIKTGILGFVFGAADSNNFDMWQINCTSGFSQPTFRPHTWSGGNVVLSTEVGVGNILGSNSQAIGKSANMTIDVAAGTIKTYLNGTLISTINKASTYSLRKIGFRSVGSGEEFYIDEITIKNGKDAVVYEQSFNDSANTDFTSGTVSNGSLLISGGGLILQNDAATDSEDNTAPMLRREFTINNDVASARLYVTAAGVYEMYINGDRVGDSYLNPGSTQYTDHILYQTYDVTEMLKKGDNAIGGILGRGWYNGMDRVGWADEWALYAKMVVTLVDGSTYILVTDENWKCYRNGPILDNNSFTGLTYDARREVEGWAETGLDDSNWENIAVYTTDYLKVGQVKAQEFEPIRAIMELKPVSVSEPQKGVFVYDFGQNFSGITRINATAPEGTTMKLRYAEAINTDNMQDASLVEGMINTSSLRGGSNTDYYTFKGDINGETFEPSLIYRGFRYMELTGLDEAIPIDDVVGLVLCSDLEDAGSFETSNELINRFYLNTLWGQYSNFTSIPTDCPQRPERYGWTGDAQVFARTASYNMNVYGFYRQYLEAMRDLQHDNGGYTEVAPGYANGWGLQYGNATNGWADAGVIIPWQMYQQYGDVEIIKENYAAMCAWISYCVNTSTNYIRAKGWTGDWLSVNETTPFGVTDTAYCAYSAKLVSKMAEVIGKTADAEYYNGIFEKFRAAWNREFVNADGSTKCNTQTSYLLGLEFGLFPENLREAAAGYLVENIKNNNWHLTTGFLGINLLLPVLSDMGYSDVAYKLMEQTESPSFLYSVTKGATTIWESWTAISEDENGALRFSGESLNHFSYGSPVEWLIKDVAGIERDDNGGYKHFVLQPTTGGSLTYAKATFDSNYGEILSHWSLDGNGTMSYLCTVPANTTATLYLPMPSSGTITEGGIKADLADGIIFMGIKDGKAVYELESGSYSFCVPNSVKKYTLNIDCANEIDATAIIDGVEYALPVSEEFVSGTRSIEVVSNDADWEFEYFIGEEYKTTPSLNLFMVSDKQYEAVFRYVGNSDKTSSEYTLSIDSPKGGVFIVNGEKIEYPFAKTYAAGTAITVEAVSPENMSFAGFNNGEFTGNTLLLELNKDISLTADFTEDAKVFSGEIKIDGEIDRAKIGERFALTAIADTAEQIIWTVQDSNGQPIKNAYITSVGKQANITIDVIGLCRVVAKVNDGSGKQAVYYINIEHYADVSSSTFNKVYSSQQSGSFVMTNKEYGVKFDWKSATERTWYENPHNTEEIYLSTLNTQQIIIDNISLGTSNSALTVALCGADKNIDWFYVKGIVLNFAQNGNVFINCTTSSVLNGASSSTLIGKLGNGTLPSSIKIELISINHSDGQSLKLVINDSLSYTVTAAQIKASVVSYPKFILGIGSLNLNASSGAFSIYGNTTANFIVRSIGSKMPEYTEGYHTNVSKDMSEESKVTAIIDETETEEPTAEAEELALTTSNFESTYTAGRYGNIVMTNASKGVSFEWKSPTDRTHYFDTSNTSKQAVNVNNTTLKFSNISLGSTTSALSIALSGSSSGNNVDWIYGKGLTINLTQSGDVWLDCYSSGILNNAPYSITKIATLGNGTLPSSVTINLCVTDGALKITLNETVEYTVSSSDVSTCLVNFPSVILGIGSLLMGTTGGTSIYDDGSYATSKFTLESISIIKETQKDSDIEIELPDDYIVTKDDDGYNISSGTMVNANTIFENFELNSNSAYYISGKILAGAKSSDTKDGFNFIFRNCSASGVPAKLALCFTKANGITLNTVTEAASTAVLQKAYPDTNSYIRDNSVDHNFVIKSENNKVSVWVNGQLIAENVSVEAAAPTMKLEFIGSKGAISDLLVWCVPSEQISNVPCLDNTQGVDITDLSALYSGGVSYMINAYTDIPVCSDGYVYYNVMVAPRTLSSAWDSTRVNIAKATFGNVTGILSLNMTRDYGMDIRLVSDSGTDLKYSAAMGFGDGYINYPDTNTDYRSSNHSYNVTVKTNGTLLSVFVDDNEIISNVSLSDLGVKIEEYYFGIASCISSDLNTVSNSNVWCDNSAYAVLGDLNGDQSINILDYILSVKLSAEESGVTAFNDAVKAFNDKGTIGTAELIKMKKYILGVIDKF